jgi:hypothetical protein
MVEPRADSSTDGHERTRVRFVGGPWDAMASYYFGLEERPPMPCAHGAYVFESSDVDGVVYTFRYGVPAGA